MEQITIKNPTASKIRKVSVSQAVKVLKRNGVKVNEDQAVIILDFLYLLAKTYNNVEGREFEKREIFECSERNRIDTQEDFEP